MKMHLLIFMQRDVLTWCARLILMGYMLTFNTATSASVCDLALFFFFLLSSLRLFTSLNAPTVNSAACEISRELLLSCHITHGCQRCLIAQLLWWDVRLHTEDVGAPPCSMWAWNLRIPHSRYPCCIFVAFLLRGFSKIYIISPSKCIYPFYFSKLFWLTESIFKSSSQFFFFFKVRIWADQSASFPFANPFYGLFTRRRSETICIWGTFHPSSCRSFNFKKNKIN